ncbi:unnamed protein product [Dicrocoelium dendriticum]|nr:unnamed protein product [Dicrocoelium dendriticum]
MTTLCGLCLIQRLLLRTSTQPYESMYPLTLHKLILGGGGGVGGESLSSTMDRPLYFPAQAHSAHVANNDSASLLSCRTPSSLCERALIDQISPSVDEGYSSVSSLSTLIQSNRDSLEPIFNSTPTRLELGHRTLGERFHTDSELGSRYALDKSVAGRRSLVNPPHCTDSFWTSFGSELHRCAPHVDPTAAFITPLVQPVPVGFYASKSRQPMGSIFQSLAHLSGGTYQPIQECHGSFNGCIQGGKLTSIPVHEVYNSDTISTEGLCKQVISSVRAEMTQLIDNSVKQLQKYLEQSFMARDMSVGKYIGPETECTPLNLKSIPRENSNLYMQPLNASVIDDRHLHELNVNADSAQGTSLDRNEKYGVWNALTDEFAFPESEKRAESTQKSPTKSEPLVSRRRRNRIRTGARRLRLRQFASRLAEKRRRDLDAEIKESECEGTLDLRVRLSADSKLTVGESETFYLTTIGDVCSQPQLKVTSLTASHLKRAKLMFMYSRYPTSNTLKPFFPEVAFTRATTAQIVKWFSNFR